MLKTAASPPAAVLNISLGTWRMLMHEKPCLIPVLSFYITLLRFIHKSSPYHLLPFFIDIVQVIFYFLRDHWAHPSYFENRIPLKPALVGCVCSLANYSVAYEETQSNRVSDFRDFVCSFFSKSNPFWLIFMYVFNKGYFKRHPIQCSQICYRSVRCLFPRYQILFP